MSTKDYQGGESRIRSRELQPAMTFEEIGAALGCSRKAAFMTYRKALAKLRARPRRLAKLRELLDSLDR